MTRRLISSGSPFEEVAGYSRAVQQDPWVFVSGTSGYKDGKISESEVEQAEQALLTIKAALEQAGASMDDVVRVMMYVTDASYFGTIARCWASTSRRPSPPTPPSFAVLWMPP